MRLRNMALTCVLLAGLSMTGCKTRPGYTARDVQPLYDTHGHARSLVLSSPAVRQSSTTATTQTPWYTDRRDRGPYVTTGIHSNRRERSITYTTDRQFIYNGRVFDRYGEVTYRRTYQDSAR